MLTAQENDLLCRVEGDAPMGRLMRRHWVPAVLSEQLVSDGAPVRVELFGEKLVAFRESPRRKPGRAKGMVWISSDFDAPLPPELQAAFNGERE